MNLDAQILVEVQQERINNLTTETIMLTAANRAKDQEIAELNRRLTELTTTEPEPEPELVTAGPKSNGRRSG